MADCDIILSFDLKILRQGNGIGYNMVNGISTGQLRVEGVTVPWANPTMGHRNSPHPVLHLYNVLNVYNNAYNL
jgi:hypothetical protein